jgi:hypothetical protein
MQIPTISKFFLAATECREYNTETGWEVADHYCEQSAEFDTRELAIAHKERFIKDLQVGKSEVFYIDIVEVKYPAIDGKIDEDNDDLSHEFETIEIVDGSAEEDRPKYMLTRYFGQYMIGQNKYELCYAPLRLTRNEIMKRIENSSFHYHPVELFATEQEARDYVAEHQPHLINSVLEFETEEAEDEE